MDEATLAGIEQRANAAKISDEDGEPWTSVQITPRNVDIWEGDDFIGTVVDLAVAEFIAHARTDVPALVAEVRRLSAALADATDVYTLRERGLRVLGDEQCCELACDGGACESCPCCCAGWCVAGHNAEIPDPVNDAENYAIWLEIAAEHNPVAKRLADVSAALAEQQQRAEHIAWERDSSDDVVGVSVRLINDLTARAEAAEAALADLRAQLRPPACEKCDDADPERPLCADCMRWVREESYAGIRAERDELRAAFARIEAMREQIESALFFKFDDNTFQKFAAALSAAPSGEQRERGAAMSRMTVIHDDHGTLVRLDMDQVGWRGQSGRFYVLGDDPSLTERGGFSPVWEISHADPVADLLPDEPPAGVQRPGSETP